jgi:hypothetical protein
MPKPSDGIPKGMSLPGAWLSILGCQCFRAAGGFLHDLFDELTKIDEELTKVPPDKNGKNPTTFTWPSGYIINVREDLLKRQRNIREFLMAKLDDKDGLLLNDWLSICQKDQPEVFTARLIEEAKKELRRWQERTEARHHQLGIA